MAKKKKGGGGLLGGAFSFVIILCLIFAWLKSPSGFNTDDPMGSFETKSTSISAWAKDFEENGFKSILNSLKNAGSGIGDGLDDSLGGGGTGSGSGGTAKSPEELKKQSGEAKSALGGLKVADAQSVNYNRDEWKHWATAPGASSCWNVREEVLWRDSDKSALVMLDKNDQKTTDKSKACKVEAGKWVDPYSGTVITEASKVDIDHMVPLSYAAQHGGQAWSASKKQDFANSLTNPRHLLASSATENRTKGDKGPSRYQPKTNKCQYAMDWISVSKSWNLTVAPADVKTLESMLATC